VIVISLVLVVVSAVSLLVGGLFRDDLSLIYVSIGTALLAGAFLLAGVLRGGTRRKPVRSATLPGDDAAAAKPATWQGAGWGGTAPDGVIARDEGDEADVVTQDTTPIDPTPVDPAPVDPAPLDPAPVDPAPFDDAAFAPPAAPAAAAPPAPPAPPAPAAPAAPSAAGARSWAPPPPPPGPRTGGAAPSAAGRPSAPPPPPPPPGRSA
jgi:hypothetical protein